jgi:hypothetical protein
MTVAECRASHAYDCGKLRWGVQREVNEKVFGGTDHEPAECGGALHKTVPTLVESAYMARSGLLPVRFRG